MISQWGSASRQDAPRPNDGTNGNNCTAVSPLKRNCATTADEESRNLIVSLLSESKKQTCPDVLPCGNLRDRLGANYES